MLQIGKEPIGGDGETPCANLRPSAGFLQNNKTAGVTGYFVDYIAGSLMRRSPSALRRARDAISRGRMLLRQFSRHDQTRESLWQNATEAQLSTHDDRRCLWGMTICEKRGCE